VVGIAINWLFIRISVQFPINSVKHKINNAKIKSKIDANSGPDSSFYSGNFFSLFFRLLFQINLPY
jgi:hypothetical protein